MVRPQETEDPQIQETYLCVVSEWQGGRNSGNCYPVFVLSQGRVLTKPEKEFPNAGAIFLPSRASFKAFDFLVMRPVLNRTYANQGQRDCYFIPLLNSVHAAEREELGNVQSILTVPQLDPDTRQIPAPIQLVTPVFFVRDQSRGNRLVGPLRREEVRRSSLNDTVEWISWRPELSDGLAWSFPGAAVEANGVRIETYQHPRPDLNKILDRPFEFIVGRAKDLVEGGEPVDLAHHEDVVRFFIDTYGVTVSPEVLKAFERIPTGPGTETPAYLRSRYARLGRLLKSARELENERRRLAREFLETEEGKRQINAEIANAKVAARAEAKQELEAERQRLLAELNALEAQKSALESEAAEHRARHEAEARSLKVLVEELSRSASLSADQLRKRVLDEIPGLVALSTVQPAREAEANPTKSSQDAVTKSARLEIEPLPPPRPFREVEDESLYVRWLRDELAETGLHFSLEMVANLFACLKCSTLTLIGGPPGVGKTSLVRTLPALLGQEHCFLELSVRRTWADDRALLGFPDTFHRRYEPGTTDFVPHLVRAMKDHEADAGGIYMILLDEFNLAPPEYYFSEFLRILQKKPDDRRLRLYPPAPAMAGDPIPPVILVGPNVSFWGTVNLDETTEPLSPRLLDRAHFIVVGVEDIERLPERDAAASQQKKTPRPAPLGPFGYRQLAQSRASHGTPHPDARQVLDRAMGILREARSDWGPPVALYPRQLREIERYLAAARPILAATASADLVINQRLLPGLRGRGEPFRRRMEALRDMLSSAALQRSASRLDRIIRHAEENYDAFDFHVY